MDKEELVLEKSLVDILNMQMMLTVIYSNLKNSRQICSEDIKDLKNALYYIKNVRE